MHTSARHLSKPDALQARAERAPEFLTDAVEEGKIEGAACEWVAYDRAGEDIGFRQGSAKHSIGPYVVVLDEPLHAVVGCLEPNTDAFVVRCTSFLSGSCLFIRKLMVDNSSLKT